MIWWGMTEAFFFVLKKKVHFLRFFHCVVMCRRGGFSPRITIKVLICETLLGRLHEVSWIYLWNLSDAGAILISTSPGDSWDIFFWIKLLQKKTFLRTQKVFFLAMFFLGGRGATFFFPKIKKFPDNRKKTLFFSEKLFFSDKKTFFQTKKTFFQQKKFLFHKKTFFHQKKTFFRQKKTFFQKKSLFFRKIF